MKLCGSASLASLSQAKPEGNALANTRGCTGKLWHGRKRSRRLSGRFSFGFVAEYISYPPNRLPKSQSSRNARCAGGLPETIQHIRKTNGGRGIFVLFHQLANSAWPVPQFRVCAAANHAPLQTPIVRPFVMLNHAIRPPVCSIEGYRRSCVWRYRDVPKLLPKFAVNAANNIGSSIMPTTITGRLLTTIGLTLSTRTDEVNHIFMMNEMIHQGTIGGADSVDEFCLYKAFRTARKALQDFKKGLKREPLPKLVLGLAQS